MTWICGFCGMPLVIGAVCECNYTGDPYNPVKRTQEYKEVKDE